MILTDYGWDRHFKDAFDALDDEGLIPARISADYGQAVRVVTEKGEIAVSRHVNDDRAYGVGDFICLRYDAQNKIYSIAEILPRKTKFSRVAAGAVLYEQIVAANIDTVFIMQSLNNDLNINRLERYLIAAWESGAVPVAVLTKSDLCDDIEGKTSRVFEVAAGIDIHTISALTGEGIDGLRRYTAAGRTVAFLGSSGVGKSTLVNALAGEEILKTQEVLRSDDRGRHTTTHRQLVLLPGGGVVMDTPGMRTLGIWEADAGMESIFGDIEELAKMCRYSNCAHDREPGCAVKEALQNGSLDGSHWENYQKLKKEIAHLERKKDQKQRIHERQFSKMIKNNKKEKW